MLKLFKATALLVVSILLITLLCRAIASYGFDITLQSKYWYRDFLGNLSVALVTALLVQSLQRTLLLSGLIIVLFQLSNAAKLSILGTPASPDDFFNIQNVFFLTDGWRRIAMFMLASLPFLLTLLFFRWKRKSAWAVLGVAILCGYAIQKNSETLRIAMDSHIGNSVWNQPANYRQRGLALHLAQETIRTISKVETPPDKSAVLRAMDALTSERTDKPHLENSLQIGKPADAHAANARNVHVFVLESFFDPTTLGTQWVPTDPLPDSFRKLWQQTGNSTALSPVFGGYTANAEFEMLCGFPVTRNAVFFEGWLRRSAPCLPRELSKAGYHSIASHPNVAGFWNRTNAYPLVGMDEYLSKADFDLTDSVANLLMDHSLYKQVFTHLKESNHKGPVFNYMLTYHGHLPYPSSENYPDQLTSGKESVLLHGYLNQIWYKSRDLMDRIEILRKNDPDALIVIFGDHLPFLGTNYGVYTEAWNLPEDRSEFTGEQLRQLTRTPLIVIDGKQGPLDLGIVPLYRLPSVIMTLLGLDDSHLFDATRNPDKQWIRPVYGMHITTDGQTSTSCTDANTEDAICQSSGNWLHDVKTLTNDIFTGRQHSLP